MTAPCAIEYILVRRWRGGKKGGQNRVCACDTRDRGVNKKYGNLDEASAIARSPRKCLVIWCGDHKQTPGGLRKTDEAKAFRRKLLRRPIALRGDTEHFQPNMLGKVVLRYLGGMDEPLINSIQVILRATMGGRSVASAEGIATLQSLCQEVGCPYHDELCFHHLLCCTYRALDGPASREVSPVGDHIAIRGRSGWIPKVGTDSPEQCKSVAGYLHRCDSCTIS